MRRESGREERNGGLTAVNALLACALAISCSSTDRAAPAARRPNAEAATPVESTMTAAPTAVISSTDGPRVLFLGTSLTAGYGLDDPGHDAWPAVLQRMADSARVHVRVVPAGLSGETSAGALRRTDWLMREKPDAVVIETGANDGLRGLDPDSTAANIRAIIRKIRSAHPAAPILLVQMEAPTNLGATYTRRFHDIFPRVAAQENTGLSPFLLNGVAGTAKLNQPDGIHPTVAGARRVAANFWPALKVLLALVERQTQRQSR
jgi:acyl-CoA thioesterase-1